MICTKDGYYDEDFYNEKMLQAIFGEPVKMPSVLDPCGIFDRKEEKSTEKNFTTWSKEGKKYRKIEFFKADTIPAGIYEIKEDDKSHYFKNIEFPTDNLMLLPGMPNEFLLKQINDFWDREQNFKDCGLLHKRGILLYGPAGCGKSSIIKMLSNEMVARNGIVLNMTGPYRLSDGLQHFRDVEPNRQILLIMEDIDGHMEDPESAQVLLSLLDGESQVNKIVYLATTNKPEVLEERIIKRPGRFDVIIGLDTPTTAARREYLKALIKDKLPETELNELADKTIGFGIAHLRELVAAHLCLGCDLSETLARLRTNIKTTPKIKGAKEMGFVINYDGLTDQKKKDD